MGCDEEREKSRPPAGDASFNSVVSSAIVSLAVSSLERATGVGERRSPSASCSSRTTQDWMGPEMDCPTLTATGKVAGTTRTTTKTVGIRLRSS